MSQEKGSVRGLSEKSTTLITVLQEIEERVDKQDHQLGMLSDQSEDHSATIRELKACFDNLRVEVIALKTKLQGIDAILGF